MSIQCTRHFISWDTPALDWAAEWILDQFLHESGTLNLDAIHIVLPGRRASRLLLGNLVDLCAERGIVLVPPMILTPGEIPSTLLGVPGQHASKITQRLAWTEALQTIDPESLSSLLPEVPEADRWDLWIKLGGWIGLVSNELCDAGLRMDDVPERGSSVLDETECGRWEILGHIQRQYEQLLGDVDRIDDRLAAVDRVASDSFSGCPDQHLILIGLPELGSVARLAVERSGCSVDSLIYAPERLADRFDEIGCILDQSWINAELDIDESRIVFMPDNESMCEQALVQLALRDSPVDTSSCVIGLADDSLYGPLERKAWMSSNTIELHPPTGMVASQTSPGLLIGLIQSHLSEHTFDSLAKLIRHPAFERALTTKLHDPESDPQRPPAWWLRAIDLIRQDHVQTGIATIPAGARNEHAKDAQQVLDGTRELLAELIESGDKECPFDEWATRLGKTLQQIYQGVDFDLQSEHDRPITDGLRAIGTVFDEVDDAKRIGQAMPMTSAHAAIGVVLARLGEIVFPQMLNRDAIETLGWLELPLDPSAVCIVVGMSENCIPGSITHDPLLPGSLRNALGMTTNEDRLARDTYHMMTLNATRDAVFLCARTGDKNDPVTPSRLLLKASGATLAERIRRFVNPSLDAPVTNRLSLGSTAGRADHFAPILQIDGLYASPTSMRVTDFDAYLQSPALWYLQRKLNLNDLDTTIRELSPAHLGTLIHTIFEGFGKDPSMRDLDDPDSIDEALNHLLDAQAKAQFGPTPPAAVQVQIQLLRQRLSWFARHQANRRRQGWTIAHTEWSPSGSSPASLLVDNEPMELRGKIDRIDTHEDGRIAIIDYKTGKLLDAKKSHQHKDQQNTDQWKKLQLPLYRSLARSLIGESVVELGYAGLPTSPGDQVWAFADWCEAELDDADEAARQIVRTIRAYKAGDPLEMGDSPPGTGILGFITGQRFEAGGHTRTDDSEENEEGAQI